MSQHVPVSLRARTAADIIIVYIGRLGVWTSFAPFPLYASSCREHSLGEAVTCVLPVRGTRVLGVVSRLLYPSLGIL